MGWAGGIDFVRMIVDSLASLENPNLEIHVLLPDRGPLLRVRRAVRATRYVAKWLLRGEFRTLPEDPSKTLVLEALGEDRSQINFHHIDAGRMALSAICRKLQIDVLVPVGWSLGKDFPIPWVGYIYDFQHKYFPEYFTPEECRARDKQFENLAADANAIIVNAHAVAEDASKFLRGASAEIVALPFAAAPVEEWLADLSGTGARYGVDVDARYFIISNQFWLHKRHDIAFAAFCELVRLDASIQLVCTGQTVDSRDPNYFPGLMQFLDDNGLSGRVRILGLIPKRDQIELLKNSIAVIQPTSFEGGPGGGSVYDAVSLGVPTIVSDIPVNREIEKWVTVYFPLNDAFALYEAMAAVLQQPRVSRSSEILRELGLQRRRACGVVLLNTLCKQTGRSV
jgi:glycosyltransferase involved in cell wall biosynthesis